MIKKYLQYIKESSNFEFEIGDYILFDLNIYWELFPYGKVINKNGDNYYIEAYNKRGPDKYNKKLFWSKLNKASRKLTLEEIQKLEEIKKQHTIKNYNL